MVKLLFFTNKKQTSMNVLGLILKTQNYLINFAEKRNF